MEFREKISRDNYLRLKAEIKGRSAMGTALREEAGRNRGFVRSCLRQMKTDHAVRTRFLLLSLAVLKGRKHLDVEATFRDDPYAPNVESLWKFMSANVYISSEYRRILQDEVGAFFADDAKEAAA
jgi:hypothetical protein